MAENKNSFLAYTDWKGMFDALPDDVAGKLVKHLFAYVNYENPTSDDYVINALFEPIKATLKRDLEKWENSINEKSLNGRMGNLKRYHLDLYKQVKAKFITLEEAENIAKSRKVSQGDTPPSQDLAKVAVSDSVSVSVSVSDIINNNNMGANNDVVAIVPKNEFENIDFIKLLDLINTYTKRNFRTINKSVQSSYKARLKEGYAKDDILQAVKNACQSKYHIESNYQYLTPEFFSRASTLDKYCDVTEKVIPKQPKQIPGPWAS